jgi:hypothetical protein
MKGRSLAALAVVGALALIPLGAATASATSAKGIAYVTGAGLVAVPANGSSTTEVAAFVGAGNPSLSTDGQLILFDDGNNVYRVSAAGGAPSHVCDGRNPAISPDGTKFAYEEPAGTVLVSPLACDAATVVASGSAPAWSPDGTQIVFISGNDLAVVSATGGTPAILGSTPATESDPTWSPDGARIAYVSNNELFVANADGTGRSQLTNGAGIDSAVAWAPAGDEVVYETGGNLLAHDVGSGSTRVVRLAANASAPTWGLAIANTSPPTIVPAGGVFREGVEVSAGKGLWDQRIGGITGYAFQWESCGNTGAGCVPISGATGETYLLQPGDVGGRIRVRVTASTADGSAPGFSALSDVVAAAGPAPVTAPSITGTFVLGQTLTASTGTWQGSGLVFAFQWQRCTASGDCTSPANVGANANQYSLTADDVGSTIRVRVTAVNSLGSATAESVTTGVIASNRPVNTKLPSIEVDPPVDEDDLWAFDAHAGEWSGSPLPTFRYQWRRCDSGGNNCTDIPGATTLRYIAVAADVGKRLRVAVTGTNTFGAATAVSDATDVVAGVAPAVVFRPTISGSAEVGEELTSSNGTWSGTTPLTYTFQWRRCNASGTGCTPVGTGRSYVVQAADVGSTIVVAVTATNAVGNATSQSTPTRVVTQGTTTTPPPTGTPQAVRPTAARPPSINGRLVRGSTLAAVVGTWTGTAPLTYTYAWERCRATTAVCTAIPRATGTSYVLAAADVASRIRLRVTATNTAGSTIAYSAISARVTATAPATTAARTINGTARPDRLTGGAAADTIHGRGGNDRIVGGAGADALYGEAGNDTIVGGAARDRMFGGAGNDRIEAADGQVDRVDCGAGRDRVVADRNDVVRNCETVVRRGRRTTSAAELGSSVLVRLR